MDSNVKYIRNTVQQGSKIYCFVKRLNYLYLPCILIPLIVAIIVQHHANYIILIAIWCGNTCLPDFRNLCDIVKVGCKRKYVDRQTKCFSICTKPTLFSVQLNGQTIPISLCSKHRGVCVQSNHKGTFYGCHHLANGVKGIYLNKHSNVIRHKFQHGL